MPQRKFWEDCYVRLIERARSRAIEGYVERHHVLPRSMGGSDEPENIVCLTAREHLIAHKLLCRFVPEEHRKKALGGLWAMAALRCDGRRVQLTSREFERLRVRFFESRRGVSLQPETKARISSSLKGRKVPEEVIRKRTQTRLKNGKPVGPRRRLTDKEQRVAAEKARQTRAAWSEEKKQAMASKLSEAGKGKKRSPEQRERISAGLTGRRLSTETKLKIGEVQRGQVREARCQFTLRTPTGEVIASTEKVQALCQRLNLPVKYLYLSLKNGQPIKRGKGKGWQLLKVEWLKAPC